MNIFILSRKIYKPGLGMLYQQSGFSLIELMVSIALGLLIMTGVLALYSDLTRSNAELARMNRQVENGRLTLHILQQELWHAGYWDTYVPVLPSVLPPTAIPNPCLAFSDWDAAYISNIYSIPVQGYTAGGALPSECSSIVTNRQADSDVLVIRSVSTCVAGVAGCESFTVGKLYLQTQLCGDITHTHYVPGAAATPLLSVSTDVVYKKDCVTVADKRKMMISIFYVRNYSVSSGDGIPALMRADFDLSGGIVKMQTAQPIIEGIQSIRFEYGRDTDGNGSADIFDDCTICTALDWANVVAVQVYVLARNLEASAGYVEDKTYRLGAATLGPFNDGYVRHAYSSYIGLMNPSGRREKP